MGVHDLAHFGSLQAPKPTAVPGMRYQPQLASTGSPMQRRSKPHTKILGDIVHEEGDSMQASQANSTNPPLPNAGTVRKRPAPTARKDEWQDSSDDGEGEQATVPNYQTSKPFQSRLIDSLPNKGSFVNKKFRFHKISKPMGAERKGLSQSKAAADFRNRREVEEAYRKKVCALIDDDILERVDAEGGITPAGRLFKAIYRMMERQGDGKLQAVATQASHDEIMRLRAENRLMRERMDEAARALRSV
ncbi:hypothetical protein AYL99_00145 [Fonsecaea erecta]|uniref:Uncharacterized protein n=1 Tax=Fonsecaea erecta TaxID=1367422 RepID=A0A178ZY59_9EURO|nr:hypothetical protein AYL99_00145 [Fonsecaea erecta]OAP64173.1 hypothetical protein AYL99_00145 [Fonsecaea erecta]